MKYLLDVDGTLTDSRKPIDTEFAYGTGKFYNVEGWKDTWEILRISESE